MTYRHHIDLAMLPRAYEIEALYIHFTLALWSTKHAPFHMGGVAPSQPGSQKIKVVWTPRSILKLCDGLCRKTTSRIAEAYSDLSTAVKVR
jgi:hypothetical protein